MHYRIGLDIGIGSIGWAVIREGDQPFIEDFGTRIFESGENPKTKESLCQERRGFRGVRRLERRRAHRKDILKNHFINIQLIDATFYDDLAACKNEDVYTLKVKALSEKLSPAQLYKCLVHTCNHRGYRDFYENDLEDNKEEGENKKAANLFESMFRESGARTVSEYLLSYHKENNFVKFRNRQNNSSKSLLIRRQLMEQETDMILRHQAIYYPMLNAKNLEATKAIMFAQRDFEDGPGDKNDPNRRYQGFLESLGQCPFHKEDKRGFRCTVISDVFAVTNTLSQYRFINKETGEAELSADVAKELVTHLMQNAELSMKQVKEILKKQGYELKKSEKSDDKALGKAVKFLKIAKKCIDEADMDWHAVISQEQFDLQNPSLLHQIGELVSKYQTPKRRKNEMEKSGIPYAVIDQFANKKFSGTASAGYQYMCESIQAFMSGDIYGNFQAAFLKDAAEIDLAQKSYKLLPTHISDPEIRQNRVVFKAVNETRKIVNAIIDRYGSPSKIIVEVASELGKSVNDRNKIELENKKREKEKDAAAKRIAEILSIDTEEVKKKGHLFERYRLWQEQNGISVYSGEQLGELKDVLENKNGEYEIDHIIPYSWILDNTLHNKVLVFSSENQRKRQRIPLQYMYGTERESYLARVNEMFSRKENPISRKKYEYLVQEYDATLHGEDGKLSQWKSRNINDTRYITKYIVGLLKTNLIFSTDSKDPVLAVKGAVTQKFRREWFYGTPFGKQDKDRTSYLNHALDAVVAANLTRAYIEIGSDALRLQSLWKKHKNSRSAEYDEYLESCIRKMEKHYGFSEQRTRMLLEQRGRIPSYIPFLCEEIQVRFFEGNVNASPEENQAAFDKGVANYYKDLSMFTVKPHMPITSHKPNRKFQGQVADANPIKVIEINEEAHKIKRTAVKKLKKSDVANLYTGDISLIRTLNSIFVGKDDSYTVEKYMQENELTVFMTDEGQPVHAVSLDTGTCSNYYKIEKDGENYAYLGGLKYYCVEIYRDTTGKLQTCGIRYVDLIKKNKKLYRKDASRPDDYSEHVTFLYAKDYIRICKKNGTVKFEGIYKSVDNINQSKLTCIGMTSLDEKIIIVGKTDRVFRYNITLLGEKSEEPICSEPLPYISESESE